MSLHCFTDGTDIVVAESIDDAIAVWREHAGERRDHDETFVPMPDELMLRISDESEETGERTAAEWANASGRGFLCSTEW